MTSASVYLRFSFDAAPDVQEKLIALLDTAGFEGFEQEQSTLHAFIPEPAFNADSFEEVLASFPDMAYVREPVDPQNWNALWESGFEPVRIGRIAGIRAAFHPPFNDVQYDLVITPKMSFGTGHHATTAMMVSAMADCALTGKRVFDFGTGTGVLAILARKMGATEVLGIDNEPWSVENALENCLANQTDDVKIVYGVAPPAGFNSYDLILANINRNILSEHLQTMANLLAPGGMLLMSGFLESDADAIRQLANTVGLHQQAQRQQEQWVALQFSK